ncbi:putative phosphodiesterase [Halotydeus destructor]|nr:putative phosphodiesterase [Halotydeus destructor]
MKPSLVVKVNPPTITQLKLPKVIMAGFLVYPAIEFEFVEPEEIKYVWYKRRLSREKHKRRGSQSSQSGDEPETDEIKPVGFGGWIKASEAFAYDVTDDDIGRNLKLVCTPARKDQTGLEVSVESLNAVVAGPEKCLFEARHLHTKNITTGDELRVVTYNVLADLYADQDYTREVLHSYCPAEALSFEYRRPLLLKEIAGYNSDLLCLQEVDAKAFDRDYKPFFAMNGMDGVFCKKGGEVAEGVAVFFRKNRFRLVTYKSTIISELLKRDSQFAGLSQKIGKNARLYARFMSRFSSFQLVLLEDITNPKRAILVGNTHLYFHPDADHIRLIQSSICFNHLEYVLTDLKEEYSYDIIAPIFCGDFNSCPEFAVYKLATTGRVDDKCEDWRSNSEEVAENVVVEHGLKLASACGLPEYTNYVGGFNGCLDYIFFDTTSFTAESFVPYPPHEEVIRHTALPSIVCPSDHIASIATLKWTV